MTKRDNTIHNTVDVNNPQYS